MNNKISLFVAIIGLFVTTQLINITYADVIDANFPNPIDVTYSNDTHRESFKNSTGEINISSAAHLTKDDSFISDITDTVKNKDNIWCERIGVSDIVRVSYEKNLSNGNIIDLYARSNSNYSGDVYLNVYLAGTTGPLLGTSGPVSPFGSWHYIKINNLTEPADRFDFHIIGLTDNYIEFDYIHDAVPTQDTPILNSTFGTNLTTENLTVYNQSTSDPDGDNVTNIINWYMNDASITVLNMPFEGGSLNGTAAGTANGTKDYSGYGNNGTVVNATWNSTAGHDGKGAYIFNSVSQYINIGNASSLSMISSAYTLEGWVFFTTNTNFPGLFQRGDGATTSSQIEVYLQSNSQLTLMHNRETTPFYELWSAITLNQWVHLAITWNGSNWTVYYNGAPASKVESVGTPASPNTGETSYIGFGYNGYAMNGTISEFRIYNRSLTTDQVLTLYNNRTDVIVSNETDVADTWKACITPNDGTVDGTEVCSNELSVAFTSCKILSDSGSYQLAENLTGAPNNASPLTGNACIKIAASNVVFDCMGYNITNNAACTTHGILLNNSLTNVTVRNCVVSNYTNGIYVYQSNSSRFVNNSANSNTQYGIYLDTSSYNNLTSNNASLNAYSGILLYPSSSYNTLANNTASSNTFYGIYLTSSSNYNNLTSNTINSNNLSGVFLETDSNYNTFANNTANSNANNGILLSSSSNNTLTNNSARSNTQYGIYLTSSFNNTLISNTFNSNTLDGVLLELSSNNTLANNTFSSNTRHGISLTSSSNNTLTNNTGNSNINNGIHLISGSSYNTLTNNTFSSNTQYGIFLETNSNYNTLTNNSANSNIQYGIYLTSSFNNTLTNNIANANNHSGIFLEHSSDNNLTNNTMSENTVFDFYVSMTSDANCNNRVTCMTGSGNRSIYYSNASVSLTGGIFSELILCNADGSTLSNITVSGSDTLQNNGLLLIRTDNSVVSSSNSSGSYLGIYLRSSSNNTLANNTADSNIRGIFLYSDSNNNRVINNTANSNGHGLYVFYNSTNNTLANNTANSNARGIMLLSCADNNLTGNTANSNNESGIMVEYDPSFGIFTRGNTFTSNTASGNTFYGIFLLSSSNNTYINNTANSNSLGFYILSGSDNNVLTNNTAGSNSQYGIYINNSNTTNATNMHLYNNSFSDFYITTNITPRVIYLYNATFDNPLGNFQHYISINITDIVEASTAYMINWSTFSAAKPSNRSSFAQKYVDITTVTGAVSIDSIWFSWADSELSGYNEHIFELWKNNASGWTMLNNTPDITANTLSIANMNPASIYGILQVPSCQLISSSGSYSLPANATGAIINSSDVPSLSLACIKIAASDVVFDCNGYSITNDGTASAAAVVVNSSWTNVTVRNCVISNYANGLYVYQSNNSMFTNNTAYNNTHGFRIMASTGINMSSLNATNNVLMQYGFNATNASLLNSGAYSTPSGAFDVSMTGSANVTTKQGSTYTNFTTSNGTIVFHNAINVDIRTMNNNTAGISATGCSISDYDTCTLATISNNLANITNNTATATIDFGMYYNTSFGGDIYIGKHNGTGNWTYLGETNDSSGLVTYENITSFSYFAPVRFVASSSTTTTPSSSESSQSSITLSYAATCPDNNLTVSVSSGANTEVRLLLTEPYEGLVSSVTTNNNQAAFTLSKAGTYQVTALKPGYKLTSLTFSYTMCNVTGENQTTLPPIIPPLSNVTVQANDTNVTQPITPPADQIKINAESAISAAESAISAAKAAGKDTTTAESKLAEAKTQYNAGDYTKAKQLADEALTLAQNAQIAPTILPTTTTITTPDTKPKSDSGLSTVLGNTSLIILLIVLLVLTALIYLVLRRKK